jgi:hypothetical protein
MVQTGNGNHENISARLFVSFLFSREGDEPEFARHNTNAFKHSEPLFNRFNPSSLIVARGLTQPVTEICTRSLPGE